MKKAAFSPKSRPCKGARRILRSAEKLFSEKGFDAVSVSEIAKKAGVSKSTIYHHFPCKHELYLAVFQSLASDFGELLAEMKTENSSISEGLTKYSRSYLDTIIKRGDFIRLILRELLSGKPEFGRELAEQGFIQTFRELDRIFEAGQKKGELRPDFYPPLVSFLLVAGNVFFFQIRDIIKQVPKSKIPHDPEKFSRMMVEILQRGILLKPEKIEKRKQAGAKKR